MHNNGGRKVCVCVCVACLQCQHLCQVMPLLPSTIRSHSSQSGQNALLVFAVGFWHNFVDDMFNTQSCVLKFVRLLCYTIYIWNMQSLLYLCCLHVFSFILCPPASVCVYVWLYECLCLCVRCLCRLVAAAGRTFICALCVAFNLSYTQHKKGGAWILCTERNRLKLHWNTKCIIYFSSSYTYFEL